VVAVERGVAGIGTRAARERPPSGEPVVPRREVAGEAPVETMVAEQLGAPGEPHLGGNEVAAVVPRRAGIDADVPASKKAAGSGAVVAELRIQVESVCVPLEAQVVDLERGAHGREGGAS